MEHKIITIVGATCSGKTQIGIILASKFDAEIISADSRQIYKYLNIGTAKPDKNELAKIKHHFINLLEPNENYNASHFETAALKIIDNLLKNKKVPIIVGGSGLYIKALVDGIFNSVEVDEEYRNELLEKKKRFGDEYLYAELKKADPESAAKMLSQNWKRVMRALEVFHLTGQSIGFHQKKYKRNKKFNFRLHGLKWERSLLYENIDNRIDDMIENGLVSEVESLLDRGYSKNLNSLNTVGYKEIISYLEGEISLGRAIELIKRNTRRYAKRQLTWFRSDERIIWHDIKSQKDIYRVAELIINSEEIR